MITTKKTNNTNNTNNGVDIGWQKGSKWANYGNMAKMNTTIKNNYNNDNNNDKNNDNNNDKNDNTTTMLISNCTRAEKGKSW